MRPAIRSILVSLLALSLSGCFFVYKLPTRQGNVIDQKQFDLLKVGQTREQVKFLLGTPIATSPFRNDRWDYYGYYKDPRGKVSTRTISLYFDGDKLDRMDGVQIANAKKPAAAAAGDTAPAAATEGVTPAAQDPLSKGTDSQTNN
ncbi:outer membrane protein assembly factor BamE [Nevskia sp.]|uniref:outer membrane protein assembly factor BamE n=1 Tax=Nevskia sp. TaxID=1929292 RepID=UPI0025F48A4D|nr:outer membrane protein assembly factor BamE [Nevskia sp.]